MMQRRASLIALRPLALSALLVTAVAAIDGPALAGTPAGPPTVEVAELFWTPFDTADGINALALWHGTGGQNWLFAAGRKADRLLLYEAATGERKLYVGQTGDALGQMRAPAGVTTVGDFLFVAEAGNHRIQVLGLPDFTLLGTFGADVLKQPIALVVVPQADQSLLAVVLDAAAATPGRPTTEDLGRRLQRFSLVLEGYEFKSQALGASGPTTGPGALLTPLGAAYDAASGRLLVLDWRTEGPALVAFDLAGQFQEAIALTGVGEPRSLALLPCGSGGYWLLGEELGGRSQIRLLDRLSFAPKGVVRGRSAVNSRGLAATGRDLPGRPSGMVYLGHDGQGAVGLDWGEVSKALALPACATP